MTQIFGSDYAEVYDAIYREKDYNREVDLIEDILARNRLLGPRELLDLGCGTGNHALKLAERGHSVLGVDRSPSMLAHARRKTSAVSPVEFCQGDVRSLDLGKTFDAVLMMFTVLGYQTDDADLTATFSVVRRHLEPGGLFIFDVWNGPAVLAQKPGNRSLKVVDRSTCITRRSYGLLEPEQDLCRIRFELQCSDGNKRVNEWVEEHVVRYFFVQELKNELRKNKLELIEFGQFPDIQAPADEKAWNAVGVARSNS